jgi:hypothetical protein
LYILLFQVETSENPTLHEPGAETHASFHETLDVGFFEENRLPPLHRGHDLRVPMVFQMLRGEVPIPYFDKSE